MVLRHELSSSVTEAQMTSTGPMAFVSERPLGLARDFGRKSDGGRKKRPSRNLFGMRLHLFLERHCHFSIDQSLIQSHLTPDQLDLS